MKTCKKCLSMKPLSSFGVDNSTKDKLTRWCKPCRRSSYKDWYYSDHSEKSKLVRKQRLKSKLENDPEYANHAKYLQVLRDHKRRIKLKTDPEYREKYNERVRLWYSKKGKNRKSGYKYNKPDYKYRVELNKRFDSKLLKEVVERCKNQCVLCGSQDNLEFDHIIPIKLGGYIKSSKDLQLLCRSCNRFKSCNLALAEWKGMMIIK